MKSLLTVTVLVITIAVCVANPVTKTINIRPGVDEEHTVVNGEGTCVFSYSCTGGSSEEWIMELDDRGTEFHCFITRGSPSYLFFNSFKASLGGKPIAGADVLGQDFVLRLDREYIVQLNEVKSTSAYKGIVNSINLRSKVEDKDEL